jgi:hypothetical protein
MAKKKRSRLIEAAQTTENMRLWREADITPFTEADDLSEFTGKEWTVTIIGPATPADLVTIEGEEYVRSKNGRLYSVDALRESVPMWDGVKVYDNHLTEDEFKRRQGMRSPTVEWLGAIVEPFWDAAGRKVKGVFKVIEDGLATKLKAAWEQGVLDSIGLSIDVFPVINREARLEGERLPIIEGFNKILSVDLVAEPAAGGSFDRLLAATTESEGEVIMDREELQEMVSNTVAEAVTGAMGQVVPDMVRETLAEALAEAETLPPDEDLVLLESESETNAASEAIRLVECRVALGEAIQAARLGENGAKLVRQAFGGRIFEEAELAAFIKSVKETEAANDPTGRVTENGQRPEIIIDEADKKAAMLSAKLMGPSAWAELDQKDTELVRPRVRESVFDSWVNGGRPNINFGGRLSELIRTAFLNGGWTLDDVSYQEAITLATVIKNTVNIMTAVDYAGSNRWYEQIADVIETDNPVDDLTLARLFGADSLDVVNKGDAYTEMVLHDEEETASHVKQGNYVGIYLEELMSDKINYFRTLPTRLADAWYNTLSAKVAAVFTTNSATGPVLSDTGALFNATAVTSAGGHANLLTTALSWTQYDTVITAMLNQTARPLGVGRKLVDMGPFTILVPTNLRATSNEIRNSELKPGTANNDQNEYGPNAGEMRPTVAVVPDWTDTDNWAVMARYRGMSPIKLAFPTGMLTPQIFTADSELAGAMFTNDTIRYKLRMMTYRFSSTYDCAPVADWRLLHKSNV